MLPSYRREWNLSIRLHNMQLLTRICAEACKPYPSHPHSPAPRHLQDQRHGLKTHRIRSRCLRRLVSLLHLQSLLIRFTEASSSLPLPAVLTAPIRLDVVAQVHSMSTTTCSSFLHPLTLSSPREPRKEQTPGVRRQRKSRPPNLRRIMGYRSCCSPYPSCRRWRHPPLWPGMLPLPFLHPRWLNYCRI